MLGKSTIKTPPVFVRMTARSVAAGLCMAMAAVGMSATSAHATLMEMDLNAAGDKLITLDDVTHLEWLDVSATLGQSYNQAELTTFVTAQGFRHANVTEVSALYTNAGVTDQTGAFLASNLAAVTELISKLGHTGGCGLGACTLFVEQDGLVDLDPFNPSSAAISFLSLDVQNSTAAAESLGADTISKGTAPDIPPNGGNYLVRSTAIPEPSTWALVVGGLVLLAGFRRRRRSE